MYSHVLSGGPKEKANIFDTSRSAINTIWNQKEDLE